MGPGLNLMSDEIPHLPGVPRKARHPELRVGQIYQERGKEPPRYVQVMQIRADGAVVLQRVGPALPNALGRRSVRKAASFLSAFDFAYEEVVQSVCTRCGKKIMMRHYSDRTQSEYCGKDGVCWECFRTGKQK
jgi:hypothetical protein